MSAGYLVDGKNESRPDGDGYRREATYTIRRKDGGKIDSATLDAALVEWISLKADYVHVNREGQAVDYLSGKSGGKMNWQVTPDEGGIGARLAITMEERPLPRRRW